MKLKNKKTGEIGTLIVDGAYKFVTNFAVEDDEGKRLGEYDSLAKLNEEWEDYEEPKEDGLDNIIALVEAYSSKDSERYPKEIVKKLKAWKRLEDRWVKYKKLADLYEEWNGHEEPKSAIKDVWFPDVIEGRNNVVISFETKEEAELAARKLKAWTRLENKGFRFTGCSTPSDIGMSICYEIDIENWSMQDLQDFKILFGGEE